MLISIFVGLVAFLALYIWSRRNTLSLPPGPKPIPIFGNIHDLTSKELWITATQWAKDYGDVMYLHILGQGVIFLTGEAITDLMEKRGSIYADKPRFVMTGELCGCENMVSFTPYGDRMKRQRKLMQSALGAQNIPAYYPLLESQTRPFLRRLLANPDDLLTHVRRYAGGLTLSVIYGYDVDHANSEDKFLSMAESCLDLLTNRITSGGGIWPVDIIPALKHLPTWFPGSGFRQNASIWRAQIEEFANKPYESFKTNLRDGTFRRSFCSILFDGEQNPSSEFEADVKWTANSMYSASMDTTIVIIAHFVLALMEHPDCLKKAQTEIDSVIGDRLPTFSDRSSLPYVDCLMSETLRWAAPVPLNLPHRVTQDNVYRGMLIPKGSLVFGNIWSMLRDETIYPEPESFRPERFMDRVDPETMSKRDPRSYIFGFGRRKCPGSHLVESSIWLLMVAMLATLDISKAVDSAGHVIEPQVQFNNSIFRIPTPFKCALKHRSQQALNMIQSTETF